MFDTVLVPCPQCGTKEGFQSKSGECFLQVVELENCPPDIFADINRHSPYSCSKCNSQFQVDLKTRKSILTSELKEVLENNLETVKAEQEISYNCEFVKFILAIIGFFSYFSYKKSEKKEGEEYLRIAQAERTRLQQLKDFLNNPDQFIKS